MYLDGMKVVHPESCTRKIVHRKLYTRKIVHLELPGKLYTEKCTLGKMNTRKNVHSKNISSFRHHGCGRRVRNYFVGIARAENNLMHILE